MEKRKHGGREEKKGGDAHLQGGPVFAEAS